MMKPPLTLLALLCTLAALTGCVTYDGRIPLLRPEYGSIRVHAEFAYELPEPTTTKK